MPIEHYPQAEHELLDDRVPLWRYLEMWKFVDLIHSGKLYFSRADFLNDKHEGLPPDEVIHDVVANIAGSGHTFESMREILDTDRQSDFVCCWSADESLEMWRKFAPGGVAIRSTSGVLKAALNAMPVRARVGYVNYAHKPPRFNLLTLITTKRPDFRREKEVRAFIWSMEHTPGNLYPHVPGLAFDIDIQKLVLEVIVSPYAPDGTLEEAQELLTKHRLEIPVVKSAYTGFGHLLPSEEQIGQMFSGKKPTV